MILFLTVLFILSACSASIEEELKELRPAVEEAFKTKAKEANNENEHIQYYLPFGFEIEDETTPNNIILKNGSKTYILFYNQQEEADSEVVYQATIQQKQYDIKDIYQDDQKFGFFLMKEVSDDRYELTVGIGGVKVSSEVKARNIKSEATTMMTIANSVVNKKD